jgi:hypothetical protein
MASLVAETQLEKDVASNAGVIPIWPWLDGDGRTKDVLPPDMYANTLLAAKRANGQGGDIVQCNDPKCERVRGIGTKAMFWRSEDTSESIVPPGWANYGGPGQFTMCPNCRAQDLQDVGLGPAEIDRVDINLKHGSTGSSGASDKALRRRVRDPPIPIKIIKKIKKLELKAHARELWKNHPGHLEAALQAIDKEERKKEEEEERRKKEEEEEEERRKKEEEEERRKKRASAAESRKRKRTGGKRRRKKRTRRRRKSGGKSRRKSRGKSRRRKRYRKKRTRRRK